MHGARPSAANCDGFVAHDGLVLTAIDALTESSQDSPVPLVHRGIAAGVAIALSARGNAARGDETATEPAIRPTPLWAISQLAPSPEIAYGEAVARFGMRWQLTPLLYSFGINRRLSPWRVAIVEPLVRQSGSIELFFSPEYLVRGPTFWDGWLWRAGVRTYVPVIERGDYLSVSFGTSFYEFAARTGVSYEIGAYALFGIVGAQITLAPRSGPAQTIITLRLRYF
jgi:hypothetical protein